MSEANGKDKDLERGDPRLELDRSSLEASDYDDLDEYAALQKFITTYRDPRALKTEDEKDATAAKPRPWWAFWRGKSGKSDGGDLTVPEEWLEVDIRNGITRSEVESRRRKFGWNEIMTEKENMFLKFLSYFQGPILYGTLSDHSRVLLALLTRS
jgi:H+-transporting ATPase